MATLKTTVPASWAIHHQETQPSLWSKYLKFADSQKKYRTLWFFASLVFSGVILLPIPAALMYYYHAPIIVLLVTMTCFFTNIIANMGGAGIRATIGTFLASVAIHLVMIALVIL